MVNFYADKVFWLYFTAVIAIWILSTALSMKADWSWYYGKLPHSRAEPSAIVFSMIWPMLYILMMIAGYIGDKDLRKEHSSQLLTARIVFGASLVLNLLWTFVFFILQQPEIALVILGFYIAMIIWLIVIYASVSSIAAWLFCPLLVWLCFAFYLNVSSSKGLNKLTF